MADGTRLKELHEFQKKTELMLMDEKARRQASEEQIHSRLDQMSETQDGLQAAVMNIEHAMSTVQKQLHSVVEQLQHYNRNKSILGEGLTANLERGPSSKVTAQQSTAAEEPTSNNSASYNAIHRMEFPLFNGEEARIWIRRCLRYFQRIPIPEDQKLTLAVLERFENLDYERVVSEFNILHQETTVNAYLEKFEEVEAHMLIFNKSLHETFFMMKFISGLKEEIKGYVATMKPTTLNQAIVLARKPENMGKDDNPQARRYLTEVEVKLRKERNLFYKCDEPYTPGHRCKIRHVSMLMSEEEAKAYEEGEGHLEEPAKEEEGDVTVSFHALNGGINSNTLRVNRRVNGKEIHILIDSGSTHCLVDEKVAQVIECKLEPTTPTKVRVADGGKILSKFFCPTFCWEVQGHEFSHPAGVLKLGGYDCILGCDWLSAHNHVELDFHLLQVTITQAGKKITLKALTEEANLKTLSVYSLNRLLRKGNCGEKGELYTTKKSTSHNEKDPRLLELLHQFKDVLQEPSTLPPERAIEHNIELFTEAIPKKQHPYRYAYGQKTEIENMVKEMLKSGIIRASQSSFASPVLLVKKKDGGWRMCVDYRYLNKLIIKHNFTRPVIDELLDELHGARYFSKNKPEEEDIPKTNFITHSGHYEFLVIPFGLCNAPSTLQALTNHVFEPYLRKFVLVFFDDILVYSKEWRTHMIRLKKVLELLRKHQLYAKQSKCSFAQLQVDYLGHVISVKGVSTNPQKVECMRSWPVLTSVKALRGFPGLTGYYRKLIKGYGIISKHFTSLLKKDAFTWNSEAEMAFNRKPIAYLSKALALKNFGLSTYEKEFLPFLLAVRKWNHYLQGNRFIIRTDQKSLKHILDKRIDFVLQQKLEHQKVGPQSKAITAQIPLWVQELQDSYEGNTLFQTVIQAKSVGTSSYLDYSYETGLLKRGNRICVGSHGGIRDKIIKSMHDSALTGHSGINGTYQRIKPLFYWPTLKEDVQTWVNTCETLQPLPIPDQAWSCISMDFIKGLPNSEGKDSILVIVDRLTKYSHFLGLKHPYTAASIAKVHVPPNAKEAGTMTDTSRVLSHHTDVMGLMQERVKMIELLKDNLHQAQQRMKLYADRKRSEREFEPYTQTSVAMRKKLKLSSKYFGPYMVVEKIGKVAYKLSLPPGTKIHPVFHVSLLKKKIGAKYFPSVSLPEFEEIYKVYPVVILARRLIPRNDIGVAQVLIGLMLHLKKQHVRITVK
ncbi:UNVERIFIED_CONTAM: Transposon Ty3-I Gag-Pol polyprotein [Sesamum indicum]